MQELVVDFPQLRYVLIGDGQERERLTAQIKAAGLEHNVFLAGSIFEAGGLLTTFDLFVFPSRSEAFGYVLLEAGAANLPVVATNVGGITEVVIDHETGLLVSRDSTSELTAALKTMLQEQSLRDKLAAAHHARSQTFTIDKMVEETLKIYQKLF